MPPASYSFLYRSGQKVKVNLFGIMSFRSLSQKKRVRAIFPQIRTLKADRPGIYFSSTIAHVQSSHMRL